MKTPLLFLCIASAAVAGRVLAADGAAPQSASTNAPVAQHLEATQDAERWGATTNGLRMGIAATNPPPVKEGQPLGVVIRIKNLSKNTLVVVWTGDPLVDFGFRVTSPSGKDVSPKQREYPRDTGGARRGWGRGRFMTLR